MNPFFPSLVHLEVLGMVVVLARLVLVRVDVELGAAGSVPLVAPRLEQAVQYLNFCLSVIRIRLFPFDADPDLDFDPTLSFFLHVGVSIFWTVY
jgi:hypothetical protein